MDLSFCKSEMGRLFVLLEPAEVLDVSPKVDSAYSFVIDLVLLFFSILESVRSEHHSIAEFDDGFAGDENGKGCVVGVVYSELMTVDF